MNIFLRQMVVTTNETDKSNKDLHIRE